MLISFIGGGNMATALVKGLQQTGDSHISIQVCTPSDETRARFRAKLHVETHYDLAAAIHGADVVVLEFTLGLSHAQPLRKKIGIDGP